MILKNKPKGKLTLQDLFSNEILQHSLENLSWTHAENEKNQAWEHIKFSTIAKESEILSLILAMLKKRTRRGEYIYSVLGNRIERQSELIKPKRKYHPDFKVSKVFTEILKPIEKIKGYVKIE